MLQKNPSKNPFYKKVKMFAKGSFVIDSFVTIGSFDCDCTQVHFKILFVTTISGDQSSVFLLAKNV
jgi:hypothetical protein